MLFLDSVLHPLPRRRMLLLAAALLSGLALSVLLTNLFALHHTGRQLRADTLRLHIRAASDSIEDQTEKLRVRNLLLTLTESLCANARSRAEAEAILARNLPTLGLLCAGAGSTPAEIGVSEEFFPTRQYPGFTLPAGRYHALHIRLGQHPRPGKNWWCVLYPGLCLASCGDYDQPSENDLVLGEQIVRLRCIELWQQLTAPKEEKTLLALS